MSWPCKAEGVLGMAGGVAVAPPRACLKGVMKLPAALRSAGEKESGSDWTGGVLAQARRTWRRRSSDMWESKGMAAFVAALVGDGDAPPVEAESSSSSMRLV